MRNCITVQTKQKTKNVLIASDYHTKIKYLLESYPLQSSPRCFILLIIKKFQFLKIKSAKKYFTSGIEKE